MLARSSLNGVKRTSQFYRVQTARLSLTPATEAPIVFKMESCMDAKWLAMLPLLVTSCGVTAEYGGPWQAKSPDVTLALATNEKNGCDHAAQKESASTPGTFLVACTSDGHAFHAFIVRPALQQVYDAPDTLLEDVGLPSGVA
jgi:hypothetical protein